MTLSFNDWLSSMSSTAISAADRAIAAWDRIQRKPHSIVIRRGSSTLSAQTVRVEFKKSANLIRVPDANAENYERAVVVFGVKDHPDDAVADTDIQAGDKFGLNAERFTVHDIVLLPGEIQATCRRVQ